MHGHQCMFGAWGESADMVSPGLTAPQFLMLAHLVQGESRVPWSGHAVVHGVDKKPLTHHRLICIQPALRSGMRAAAPGVTNVDGVATLPPPPLATLVESANGQPPAAAPAHAPDPGGAGGPLTPAAAPVASPGASPAASPAVSPGASPAASPAGETLALSNDMPNASACGTQPSYAAYCAPFGAPYVDLDGVAFQPMDPEFFSSAADEGFTHPHIQNGEGAVEAREQLPFYQGQCQARSRR